MNRQPHDPVQIVDLTLEHYNQRAREFRDSTRDHDVSQNIGALLRHIEAEPPYRILDFGCGPGRDLRAFARLGHVAIGLEGAAQFVTMARADSGCEVWQQDFLRLDLPDASFDGVYANASLFHVPSRGVAASTAGSCAPRSSPAASCSAPIRAARMRKAGIAAATAPTTTLRPGSAI